MKLCRFRWGDKARLGVVVSDAIRPLDEARSALMHDDITELITDDSVLNDLHKLADEARAAESISLDEVGLLCPIVRPGKIIAVGRNYRAHTEEEGTPAPEEPVTFAKFPSALVGPNDNITWDRHVTSAVDFEAELAVVIGRETKDVRVEEALESVFGYSCLNDVSARDIQFGQNQGGQWVLAKSLDTFCPVGPWLVTSDEIDDPQCLGISCMVSGETVQDANTADMIFSVAELIAYLSRRVTLDPGDVIATGTPAGVGWFREPRRMLRQGDEVLVTIGGIGTLRNVVRLGRVVSGKNGA